MSPLITIRCVPHALGLACLFILFTVQGWGDDSPVTTEPVRTDLWISGIYPHLTTYGVYSQNGAHNKSGHNECGIGAIVPWAGKLWMVNYAPHMPRGSEHKLYSVDPDFKQPLTIHPESVGGTPAGRMLHAESKQLLIAHYLIDADGHVRVIPPTEMPIRVTAIARHLTDPANLVYYIDMEGSIWEANVHTLAVKQLFKKPVPGWHGKGGYTSQGRLVVSNNGELHVGNYSDLLVGGEARNEEERGVLAEFNGQDWSIVERRQYTEVTGPKGIVGGSDGNDPLWAIGWDKRSLRLKVLDNGKWHTFLLPKASYCNDASHGWYTEWPRIRQITEGRWMLDMHGMFFDFPPTFAAGKTQGLLPIGSHLRYVPDFCDWNGQLVLATDETSIQENHLAGQPQSNLWFGSYKDLKTWGPASGYGGPWLQDEVKANTPSDPFLIAGFDRRMLHLALGHPHSVIAKALRASDQQEITDMPDELAGMARVTLPRGDWHEAAPGFEFDIDRSATVFLAVDERGNPQLDKEWKLTELSLMWGQQHRDKVYRREFPAGRVSIPSNQTEHTPGSFGMPHMAFVANVNGQQPVVNALASATVTVSESSAVTESGQEPVTFTLEIDRDGSGTWSEHGKVTVPAKGYTPYTLPTGLNAVWLRLTADRDCVATAVLHQTTATFHDGNEEQNQQLFEGLASVGDADIRSARIYAAKRNRNLQVITADDYYFDFTKSQFEFQPDEPDPQLNELLDVKPEFSVDDASVVIRSGGTVFRLPKGNAAYDEPLAGGWPRALREVESERELANIHGTFYEVPLVTNGAPPAWNLMRPVSSHTKAITDYCSWNGLLVLAGVHRNAKSSEHVFANEHHNVALWFGGIDDLWKLGKPVGRGGPLLRTRVKANVPSHPYLMRGYDRKTMALSHSGPEAVKMSVEVDITGTGLWCRYHEFQVPPDEALRHEFPAEFSAFWMRVVCDRDAVATVQLQYE